MRHLFFQALIRYAGCELTCSNNRKSMRKTNTPSFGFEETSPDSPLNRLLATPPLDRQREQELAFQAQKGRPKAKRHLAVQQLTAA